MTAAPPRLQLAPVAAGVPKERSRAVGCPGLSDHNRAKNDRLRIIMRTRAGPQGQAHVSNTGSIK